MARCELIGRADREDVHPCHAVVRSQGGAGEYDRQVPKVWAGNLHAENYPRASWSDDTIVEFQGRHFDQALPASFVKNGRYLQQDGLYADNSIRFWTSVQRRAEELLGPTADPSVNYVMTEVVHCKSKNEVGVSQAAATCAKRYLNDISSLTDAPLFAVVGRKSHDCLNNALGLGLPEPPYITSTELGGRLRHLVFIWHPAGRKGPKTFGGLHGKDLDRLRNLVQNP